MSQARDRSDPPRAIIHKRILDVAESRPDASMAELADEVTGASTEMVEKVLDEYGGPGEEGGGEAPPSEPIGSDSTVGATAEPESDGSNDDHAKDLEDTSASGEEGDDQSTDPDADADSTVDDPPAGMPNSDPAGDTEADPTEPDLTDRQLKTLRLIRERPDASQADIAEAFDVTRPTISRWVNDIPGFDWQRRSAIADSILNGTMNATATTSDQPSLEDLQDRLQAIETQLETGDTSVGSLDPDLAHKVMHACLHSDRITEDEELKVLRAFMGSGER